MPYIYQITNRINGKIYIGKTINSLEQRWKQHYYEMNSSRIKNRPLYNAMRKYGFENFSISVLEETSIEELSIKEREWIENKQSFIDGYNATLGGDGVSFINREKAISLYEELHSMNQVAEIMNISSDSVSLILHENNVHTLSRGEATKKRFGKAVKMFKDEKFVDYFSSQHDVARYLIENNFTQSEIRGLGAKVGQVCKGKRKSLYGFTFQYA